MADAGDDGFQRASGPSYFDLLSALHRSLAPDLYLEIGSRTGNSLAIARGDFIAVDPAFNLKRLLTFPGRQGHLFQMTSDEFFASGFLESTGRKPGFAFLDGMHLFEFLLRDFMNAEARMGPEGVIALHDCCPYDAAMAARERGRTRAWTGDVWKLVPILQELRPDLSIEVFDAAPTGLVVIRNLDPESRILAAAAPELEASLRDVTIEGYGPARFYASFPWASAADFIAGAPGE